MQRDSHSGRLVEFQFDNGRFVEDERIYGLTVTLTPSRLHRKRSAGAKASWARGKAVTWPAIAEVLDIDESRLRLHHKKEPLLRRLIKKRGKSFELDLAPEAVTLDDWMRLTVLIMNARRKPSAAKSKVALSRAKNKAGKFLPAKKKG